MCSSDLDGKLRAPTDGSQWRKIERKYWDEFASDPRNVWFALSADGINPFGEQSSNHSTWPMTLCMYNLPPWMCMKRKFIMMPALIQGPKQPGNDIDVYLRPWMRTGIIMNFRFMHIQGGRLYIHRVMGQVL